MAAYCQVYGVIHFTSPAGWLPVHRDQLRAQRSVTSMGKIYLFSYQLQPSSAACPTTQHCSDWWYITRACGQRPFSRMSGPDVVWLYTGISHPQPHGTSSATLLQPLSTNNPNPDTTHTHTRLTALCPWLPRWVGTRMVKPIWILLEQETVSCSGISWAICKSAPRSRQITTPAPHHSCFLQARCPSCRPTNSVKALKANATFYPFYKQVSVVVDKPKQCIASRPACCIQRLMNDDQCNKLATVFSCMKLTTLATVDMLWWKPRTWNKVPQKKPLFLQKPKFSYKIMYYISWYTKNELNPFNHFTTILACERRTDTQTQCTLISTASYG